MITLYLKLSGFIWRDLSKLNKPTLFNFVISYKVMYRMKWLLSFCRPYCVKKYSVMVLFLRTSRWLWYNMWYKKVSQSLLEKYKYNLFWQKLRGNFNVSLRNYRLQMNELDRKNVTEANYTNIRMSRQQKSSYALICSL